MGANCPEGSNLFFSPKGKAMNVSSATTYGGRANVDVYDQPLVVNVYTHRRRFLVMSCIKELVCVRVFMSVVVNPLGNEFQISY